MGISAPVSPPPQFHAEKRPAVWGGLLSWSFTTLAVAAKHPMSSISDYVVLESAFRGDVVLLVLDEKVVVACSTQKRAVGLVEC